MGVAVTGDWKLLAELARGTSLVSVTRGVAPDPISGFPVQVGKSWAVLAQEHGAVPWGLVAIRRQDISAVSKSDNNFVRKALKANEEWPVNRPAWQLDLSSAGALLTSAAAVFGIVTVALERLHPDECYVGVPVRVGKRELNLLDLGPDAKWKAVRAWDLQEVTLLEFGDPYSQRLLQVAGPRPDAGA